MIVLYSISFNSAISKWLVFKCFGFVILRKDPDMEDVYTTLANRIGFDTIEEAMMLAKTVGGNLGEDVTKDVFFTTETELVMKLSSSIEPTKLSFQMWVDQHRIERCQP